MEHKPGAVRVPRCEARGCSIRVFSMNEPNRFVIQHGENPEAVFVIPAPPCWTDLDVSDDDINAYADWLLRMHEYETAAPARQGDGGEA